MPGDMSSAMAAVSDLDRTKEPTLPRGGQGPGLSDPLVKVIRSRMHYHSPSTVVVRLISNFCVHGCLSYLFNSGAALELMYRYWFITAIVRRAYTRFGRRTQITYVTVGAVSKTKTESVNKRGRDQMTCCSRCTKKAVTGKPQSARAD